MRIVKLLSKGALGALLLVTGVAAPAGDRALLQLERSAVDVAHRLDEVVGEVVGIEKGLAGPATDLKNSIGLYRASCGSAKGDSGCADMMELIRGSYVEVLNTLEPALPELREDVEELSHKLHDVLYPAIARKTPQQIYHEIQASVEMPRPGADMPLSASLRHLADLLGGSRASGVHVIEMTLATQADLLTATGLIELLEVLVAREKLVVARTHSWVQGRSGDFVATMGLVRELFGLDTGPSDDPPPPEQHGHGWINSNG